MPAAPGLTAALIVKNEARFLGGCLESLRGIADEIVVVDTGSTDETRDIARSFGARLFAFRWRGRFDDARNEALRRVRTPWVLYIDADERVEDGDHARLHASLAVPGLIAARVAFVPRLGYTEYREWRIFRNHPRIRFRGGMHETLLPALEEVGREEGGLLGDADLRIVHLGYEGDLTRKHTRNLPLLRQAVREDPERLYLWSELGRAAAALGETTGAEEAFREAVRLARAHLGEEVAFLPFADLLYHLVERGGGGTRGEAESLAREALRLFPENPDLRWLSGRALQEAGRHEEALACFEWLLHVDPTSFAPNGAAFDRRIFGPLPVECAAECCFALGRNGLAYGYWSLAAELAPERLELRMKAALAAKRAGVVTLGRQPGK